MVKLGKALIIVPGGSPQESVEYVGACKALGLRQSPHGHAFYLVETSAGSLTLVSAELGEPAAIWGATRSRADRSGSQNTGEQPGSTAMFGGLRPSTGAAEVVEIGLTGHPIARVVVNARSGKLEGVGVLNRKPTTHAVAEPGVANPAGRMEDAVRGAVADVLAETLVGAIWPALPSTGPLKDFNSLYQTAESLLEPELLMLKVINAAARAAAHAAGFGILAPLIGQLAEDLCAPLLRPGPANQVAGDMVKIIDIKLYAADGHLAECPALRELTVQTVADVIGKLLASGPGTQPAEPAPIAQLPTPELGLRRSSSRGSSGRPVVAKVGSDVEGATPSVEASGPETGPLSEREVVTRTFLRNLSNRGAASGGHRPSQ